MSIRVEVTAEDIAKGERKACRRCPIARAVTRVGFVGARIDLTDSRAVFELDSRLEEDWTLPSECMRFIKDFDDGKPVEPFSFDLDVTP